MIIRVEESKPGNKRVTKKSQKLAKEEAFPAKVQGKR